MCSLLQFSAKGRRKLCLHIYCCLKHSFQCLITPCGYNLGSHVTSIPWTATPQAMSWERRCQSGFLPKSLHSFQASLTCLLCRSGSQSLMNKEMKPFKTSSGWFLGHHCTSPRQKWSKEQTESVVPILLALPQMEERKQALYNFCLEKMCGES